MEELFKAQVHLSQKINAVYTTFKSRAPENQTKGAAQAQVQRLEEYFNTFNKHHEKILNLRNVDYEHEYFQSGLLTNTEDFYYENKGSFNDFFIELDQTNNAIQTLNNSSVTKESSSKAHKHLPQITIPTFSGKHTDWENFRDLFKSIIHTNESLSPVDKFFYLRTNVSNKALEIVKRYKLTVANYELAWNDLIAYYENTRRLVHTYLAELFSVKPMKGETSSALSKLMKDINSPIDSLRTLGRPTDQWSDIIVYHVVSRFEENTLKDWQKFLADSVDPPTVEQLRRFTESHLIYLEALESGAKGAAISTQSVQKKTLTSNSHQSNTQNEEITTHKKACFFCSQEHFIAYCDKFKALSEPERSKFVRNRQLCYNCLGRHSIKSCRSQRTCFHCKGKHHTFLHRKFNKNKNQPSTEAQVMVSKDKSVVGRDLGISMPKVESHSVEDSKSRVQINPTCSVPSSNVIAQTSMLSHSCDVSLSGGVLLATALIKVQGGNGIELLVRALIDPCSQASFISGSLCQRLKLKVQKVDVPIKGTGGVLLSTVTKSAEVIIKSRLNSDFTCKVDALILSKVSSYKPPSMKTSLVLPHLEGLVLADPQYMDKNHIDMLLGASVYSRVVLGTVIKGKVNEPIATSSVLGWLLSGDTPGSGTPNSSSLIALHISQDCNLDQLLQRFWLQEEVPVVSLYTKDEQKCDDHFVRTHTRDKKGRYVLRLPFKDVESLQAIDLRQSFYPSQRMLLKMEKGFISDPKLKDTYHHFLQEYEELGHMSRLSLDEMNFNLNRFYLPHHGVWKEKSSTTKLRTVFNGSLKLSSGLSLNDLLHSGPNLLPNLADLIINWRNYKFVFLADIEKMFRQILIHPDDQHYQSILWRFDPSEPIHTYKLNTVTYGLVCSPFLANRTIKQLAVDHMFENSWGAEVLHTEIYMDDVLSGGHTISEALQKQKSTRDLLALGGFLLRKWLSNHLELLKDIPSESLAVDPKSFSDSNLDISVLGLSWHPIEDTFYFNLREMETPPELTKRTVLSRIARLFDPLGWLAPVVIKAKIMMQLLWQEKKGWDDEIDVEYQIMWNKWENELSQINQFKLPRWNSYNPQAGIVEIHGFADASKMAYGASLYLRVVDGDQVFVTLLLAKSKVAPLKVLTIPRLELAAAHLLTKLTKHYLKITTLKISSTHLWSDSTDVLQWLKGQPSRWRPFVANRCASIHSDVPNAIWNYVKSKDNPADIVSRGCTAGELLNKELWWQAPKWLTQHKGPWTSSLNESPEFGETPPEENASNHKVVNVHLISQPSYKWDLVHRYSCLFKLLRVTSYCLRFIIKVLKIVLVKRQTQKTIFMEIFKGYVSSKMHHSYDEQGIENITDNVGNHVQRHLKSRIASLSYIELEQIETAKVISPSEMTRSQLFIVYLHQGMHFSAIRDCHQRKVKLPKNNQLLKLNPVFDGDLIRVGGRLVNAQLPHDNKYPLLLHPNDVFTRLVINQIHKDTGHGGIQLTLGTLRLQYWVIRGRMAVKSVIKGCHKCILYTKRGCVQLMGNLPAARTVASKPFQVAGVDYAGPIKVRLAKIRGNATQKGYIVIFVCFSTHAVHIEVVEDYSSAAFIAAFHRFTARRGQCSHLHSDQGTTFIGADSVLRKMLQGALIWSEKVQIKLANMGTQWHFNPPGAPHFGGMWESAVKSMKYHIHRMIGDQALTFIELSTLLCRVEAILNSRPLLSLSDDVSDLNPLTPAHFLIQRPSYLVPEPDLREEKIPLSKRWELLSQIVQHFWDRWSKEYLTSLQPRQKWTELHRSLKPGDLVRVRDEISFPGRWPIGIVVATHPGKDGLVRTVTVRTSQSELRRPIVKLVLLETVENL